MNRLPWRSTERLYRLSQRLAWRRFREWPWAFDYDEMVMALTNERRRRWYDGDTT